MRSWAGLKKIGIAWFISFGGRFASFLSFSMSASPNVIENTPVAEPVLSDEEDVIDTSAHAQQLREAELKNARIERKRQEHADAKKLKEETDEADRLARSAERKAAKVNKRKRVSAI